MTKYLFFASFLLLLLRIVNQVKAQVPGLVHTESGYDTKGGVDAICWFAPPFNGRNSTSSQFNGYNWKSPLVPSFVAGPTEMMQSCPSGMDIHMDILNPEGKRLRQGKEYVYHVYASVNITELKNVYRLADTAFFAPAANDSLLSKGPDIPQVRFQLLFCPLNGNLCTPFVHQTLRRRRLQNLNATKHKGEEYQSPHKHLIGPPLLVAVNGSSEKDDFYEYGSSEMDGFYEFQFEFPLGFPYEGSYLPMATLQFFIDNRTRDDDSNTTKNETLLKFDMSNLLHQRAQIYYAPMEIQAVSSGIEIITYVLIAVVALVQLALLGCVIYYRNEGVMKLSQGSFLVVLLIAGTMVTCCSVLFNPLSDIYCYLRGPMVLIPLQLMLSIIYGRLHRTVIVMGPLMEWHSSSRSSEKRRQLGIWRRAFMNEKNSDNMTSSLTTASSSTAASTSEGTSTRGSRGKKCAPCPRFQRQTQNRAVRKKYSAAHLWILIVLTVMPMVALEIVGLLVFTPDLVLETNAEESKGRYECGTSRDQIYQMTSVGLLLVTMFLAMYEANRSRNLPALFNEASAISMGLMASVFVAGLGFAVIFVTHDPETPPGIPYLFIVIVACVVSLNLSVRLVLPKLRLIWKGEKVVLSKMLAEHKMKQHTATKQSQTGFKPPATYNTNYNYSHSSGTEAKNEILRVYTEQTEDTYHQGKAHTAVHLGDDKAKENAEPAEQTGEMDSREKRENEPVECQVSEGVAYALGDGHSGSSDAMEMGTIESTKFDGEQTTETEHLVIQSGQHPPSKLIMKVLDHSRNTARINERILSGLQVNRKDWEDLKQSAGEVQELLANVEYQQ